MYQNQKRIKVYQIVNIKLKQKINRIELGINYVQ